MEDFKKGKRYGFLTIIEDSKLVMQSNGNRVRKVKVRCDCGTVKIINAFSLKDKTVSCGCYHKKLLKKGVRPRKNKMPKGVLYTLWMHMKERCNNPNHRSYERYGGRGISVCDDWSENYDSFYSWCKNNGYKRGLHLDRIDNYGNYSPDNCRFVTPTENSNNKRNNIIVKFEGIKDTLPNTLRRLGVYNSYNYKKVHRRMHDLGWSFDKAINDILLELESVN